MYTFVPLSCNTQIGMAVKLTPRQIVLAHNLLEAGTNKEIAARCGVTENTVKVYCARLYEKTGTTTRAEFVNLLWRDREMLKQVLTPEEALERVLKLIEIVDWTEGQAKHITGLLMNKFYPGV